METLRESSGSVGISVPSHRAPTEGKYLGLHIQQLSDELAGSVNLEFLFAQLRVGEIVQTGIAFRQEQFSPHLLNLF